MILLLITNLEYHLLKGLNCKSGGNQERVQSKWRVVCRLRIEFREIGVEGILDMLGKDKKLDFLENLSRKNALSLFRRCKKIILC